MPRRPPPISPQEALARGLALHRAGSIDQAAAVYAEVLAQDPNQPDALHLLGVAEQQRGRLNESVALIQHALAHKTDAQFATNLANAFLGLGRFAEAEQACRLALSLNPAVAMAHANLGVALHAQGRLVDAANALRVAIALDPARPEPQSSLGAILLEMGRRGEALTVLRVLVQAQPNDPLARYNLANAIAADQTPANLREALAHYDRAIALAPAYADAQANRAAILRRLELYPEAEQAFATALQLLPRSPLVHYNHGLLLGELERPDQALAAFDRAIALAPQLAAAHSHRGNMLSALGRHAEAMQAHGQALDLAPQDGLLHHNLGLSLGHEALYEQAAAAQAEAIALAPDFAPAHAALAAVLAELNRPQEAMAAAAKALALEPDLGAAHAALGQALMAQGDLAEAELTLERALQRRPNLSQSHLNLGVARFRLGRLAEAERDYLRALDLRGDAWEAHFNLGVTRLQQGRYAEAWPEFEHRLRAPDRRRSDARYVQPLWMGEDLAGKTLLLHGEQGLGDMLMCARFIPLLADRGARLLVEAHGTLGRLLQRMPGVAAFVDMTAPSPPADFHLPFFSLPHRLGVTLDSLPGPMPYLSVDPELVDLWRERLAARLPAGAPRVGLVWSGNVTSKVERGRSVPLAAFAPLARAVGAPLISLQKGFGLDQLQDLPAGLAVQELGADYQAGDMADTAAVMQNLDLVIACDTSVAHLAGALDLPVWMAINALGDWRWLTERNDSPWYPSLKIYRQPAVGDWAGVVAAMAADWPSQPRRTF